MFCVHRLERAADGAGESTGCRDAQRIGGGAFARLSEMIRSPYLLGVGAWVSLLSFGATIVYFEQANIVSATIHGAARKRACLPVSISR